MAIRRPGPKRRMEWFCSRNGGGAVTSEAQQTNDTVAAYYLMGDLTSETTLRDSRRDEGDVTITRIVGDFYVTTARTGSGTQSHIWAAGITILDVSSVGLSSAELPDPIIERDANWMWRRSGRTASRVSGLINGFTGAAYDTIIPGPELFERMFVDVRAQRRITKSEVPVIVVSNISSGSPAHFGVVAAFRTLGKF